MQTLIKAEDKPLGVIESLQQGFNFLNRHLWLLFPPIFLYILLWFGPRVTLKPLVQQLQGLLINQPEMPPELAPNFEAAVESLQSLGSSYNVLSLLAGLLTGMPSLLARFDFQTVVSPMSNVIQLDDWQTAVLLVLLLIPTGILFGSFWLTMMVFAINEQPVRSTAFVRRWGWVWLNANLYFFALLAAIVTFSLLFGIVGAFTLLLGPIGALMINLFWIFFLGFSVWLSIGLYFVIISVAMDGVNLARAIWRSLNVVGRNAISTLGFLILTFVLMEGFARIWARLSVQEWGVALGVFGNAYLGVAITVAAFLFYQSRYRHWRKTRALVILNQDQEDS